MPKQSPAVNVCDRELRQYQVRHPLPRFGTLLPFKRHPLDVSAEHLFLEWADWLYPYAAMSRERYDKFLCLGRFTTYFYPFGAEDRPDRFANVLKFMIILFVVDDHYEECWGDCQCRDIDSSRSYWSKWAQMCDKLQNPQSTPMTDWPPYFVAIYATLDAICVEFNTVQRHRFVETWREYGDAYSAETKLMMINPHKLTCAEQIVDIRVITIGCSPFSLMIEYLAGSDSAMTRAEWADKQLQSFIRSGQEHLLLVNDLWSFGKEFKQAHGRLETMFNVVAQTARFDQCSVREAMQVIIARVTATERSIIDKHRAIVGGNDGRPCSPAVRLFVDRVLYMLGGNYKFHTVCDRYLVFPSADDI